MTLTEQEFKDFEKELHIKHFAKINDKRIQVVWIKRLWWHFVDFLKEIIHVGL